MEEFTLFYDSYLHMIESGGYSHPQLALYGVHPGTPAYREMIRRTSNTFRAARVTVLDQQVCTFVLDLVAKSGVNLVPYLPYPKLPMFVEFDHMRIGDDTIQFSAIFAHRVNDMIMLQLLDHLGGSKDIIV